MHYLKNFLAAPSFKAEVDAIGNKLRTRYELPEVYQLGLVVPDAPAANKTMVSTSLAASLLVKVTTARWNELGDDKAICATIGFAYHQGYELELIEPGQDAGFYAQDLDPQGEIVAHHYGFLVRGVDDWVARLEKRGVPLLVRGKLALGPVTGDFAYLDTREECGIITELIDMRLLGIRFKMPQRLVASLAKLQVRSGKRCLQT